MAVIDHQRIFDYFTTSFVCFFWW